jgi:hypothetical protein
MLIFLAPLLDLVFGKQHLYLDKVVYPRIERMKRHVSNGSQLMIFVEDYLLNELVVLLLPQLLV